MLSGFGDSGDRSSAKQRSATASVQVSLIKVKTKTKTKYEVSNDLNTGNSIRKFAEFFLMVCKTR